MSETKRKNNGDIARKAALRIFYGTSEEPTYDDAYKVILDALDEYEENRRIRIVSEAARFGEQFECDNQE